MGFASLRSTPDFADTISGQYSTALPLSANAPALGCHVSHVVGLASKEKVNRVNTLRVVALVKDTQSVRDWSDHKFVGDARGDKHCGPSRSFADLSMPSIFGRARPEDAPVGLFVANAFKEAVNKRLGSTLRLTRTRAKPSSPTVEFRCQRMEKFSADRAKPVIENAVGHADFLSQGFGVWWRAQTHYQPYYQPFFGRATVFHGRSTIGA